MMPVTHSQPVSSWAVSTSEHRLIKIHVCGSGELDALYPIDAVKANPNASFQTERRGHSELMYRKLAQREH